MDKFDCTFDTFIDGQIVEDQSNESFSNLKNSFIAFLENYKYGVLTYNSFLVAMPCTVQRLSLIHI